MDAFLSDLWNCKLDLGYNAKIAAYWMTATGPMVVADWHCQCQKWSTRQSQSILNSSKFFLTELVYFESQKGLYKDETISFVVLSGWPSEAQFIIFP